MQRYRRGVAKFVKKVATGAAAYSASRALKSYAKSTAKKNTRVRVTSNIRSRIGRKQLVPVVKVRTVDTSGALTGNELSTYNRTVGKYPRLSPNRLLKLMKSGMNEVIYRAQGITNFDTNVGYYALANRGATDGIQDVLIPIHVWDLTSIPNNSPAVAGYAYRWNGVAGAADLIRSALPTTNGDGSVDALGYYEMEKGSGAILGTPNAKNACHEWANIRLNLYGARKRGTTFYIDVIRVKNELAHPIGASVANTELKNLFRQWQSKLIYSNLQTYNSNVTRDIKVVKSFKFYVPGGSADDLDTIGKIKEFKLFLKQGNVYDMSWDTSNTADDLPHTQDDGQDYTSTWITQNHPRNSSRLLLVIRAFSPERATSTTANWNSQGDIIKAPANALTEPSYDLIVRNKWLIP